MGSRVYDFLTDSFLFDDSLIRNQFRNTSDTDVRAELQRYRQFCLSVAPELEQEILRVKSNLKLFSGIRHIDISLLKQSAFYVQQYVLYDPLFALTETPTEQSNAFNKFLGLKGHSLDKAQLSHTLKYLKALTPMVAADYVKLLPTSYFFEPPIKLPITYSECGFAERVPPPLRDFFQGKAIIESGKQVKGGIRFEGGLEIGRIISIRFSGHDPNDLYGFALPIQEVIDSNKDVRDTQNRMILPDTPPAKAAFDAWVQQSINQAAGYIYLRTLFENMFSARLGAAYLAKSPFVFELLEQIVPVENSIQTNTANVLLNMNVPFLDDVDIEALMRVRSEDGEAFDNFRVELDRQLRDLRQVKDQEELRIKTENVVHELTEVQMRQIDRKIISLRKKLFTESAVVIAGLCGAIQFGDFTLPVALVAALQSYKSLKEYRSEKGETPAFFLWQVLKNSQKV